MDNTSVYRYPLFYITMYLYASFCIIKHSYLAL